MRLSNRHRESRFDRRWHHVDHIYRRWSEALRLRKIKCYDVALYVPYFLYPHRYSWMDVKRKMIDKRTKIVTN